MAKEVGVHPTTISRIWRAHGLQPHRIEYFKLSTDPHLVEKLRDVVGLYVVPRSGPLSSLSTRRASSTAPSQVFPSRRGALAP